MSDINYWKLGGYLGQRIIYTTYIGQKVFST